VSALKVYTLASGIVGNEDHQVTVLHESLDDLSAFFARYAAVNNDILWLS